jgi:hypothetical protein
MILAMLLAKCNPLQDQKERQIAVFINESRDMLSEELFGTIVE